MGDLPSLVEKLGQLRKKPEADPGLFTYENALERFQLLSAAGEEGQRPMATFAEGNTIMLSKYSPGTILREKIQDDMENGSLREHYLFWCIGSVDPLGPLTLFDSMDIYDGTDPVYRIIQGPETYGINISLLERQLGRVGNTDFRYEIGEEGALLDKCFEHMNPGKFGYTRSRRKTLQIDILQMGKPVVEKKPAAVSPNFELNPQTQPSQA